MKVSLFRSAPVFQLPSRKEEEKRGSNLEKLHLNNWCAHPSTLYYLPLPVRIRILFCSTDSSSPSFFLSPYFSHIHSHFLSLCTWRDSTINPLLIQSTFRVCLCALLLLFAAYTIVLLIERSFYTSLLKNTQFEWEKRRKSKSTNHNNHLTERTWRQCNWEDKNC